ncbi:HlyIII-domain-containing protein [Lojkania enalia]|uniref:HlyIII-domain-containing protein n=1 Tax=Lojkania enalia TaxID=147567 RepID=A0A9P4N2W9_9PLEO|nr:HlyIII-domain-containing protein [Didymosphaeria enalia]
MSGLHSRKAVKVTKTEKKIKSPMLRETVETEQVLLTWEQMPDWYQDNEYILSGYRSISGSYTHSFHSIYQIHNETLNILSHLLASLLFLLLPVPIYNSIISRYATASTSDIVVFGVFFLGVVLSFLISATYHLLSNHSSHIRALSCQLDYLGIVFLFWGSTIPYLYYGFFCTPHLQYLHYTTFSLLCAVVVSFTLNPSFRQPKYRTYRTMVYGALGASYLLPILHGVHVFGWETQWRRMSLGWMGVMLLFNGLGAIFYTMRIPEKWYPKTFDIVGASHQLMHFMTVFAALALLVGLLSAFDFAHGEGGVCGSEVSGFQYG